MRIQVIPGLFLTHDDDIDAGLFCLNAMYDKGLSEGIRFFIPVQSAMAEARYHRELPAALDIALVPAPPGIGKTFEALSGAAGAHPAYFFATSDRYPIKPVDKRLWSALCRAALKGKFDALRVTRWQENLTLLTTCLVDAPDHSFAEVTTDARFGAWHPQFISRQIIDRLEAVSSSANDLGSWHQAFIAAIEAPGLKIAVPVDPITVFEEPTIEGCPTLNYVMRQTAIGRQIDPSTVWQGTTTFTSPQIPRRNNFWKRNGISAQEVISRLAVPTSFSVFSVGGVGSKALVRWLHGPRAPKDLGRSHYHWRLPPTEIRENQSVIYIFGDPVNTALSFFARREKLHAGHGFVSIPDERSSADDYVIRALNNIEANQGDLTKEDDAGAAVKAGLDPFRIEEHLNNFLYSDRPYPVLFLRYEAIWRHSNMICDILGQSRSDFPTYRERIASLDAIPKEVARKYCDVFDGHRRRLEALPDIFTMDRGTMRVFI